MLPPSSEVKNKLSKKPAGRQMASNRSHCVIVISQKINISVISSVM
jgi:hypothetical protein